MRNLDYQYYQKMIGERVKQYRINAGLTQQDLENKSGVSVRSISRLEQGASVQFESLIKILLIVGIVLGLVLNLFAVVAQLIPAILEILDVFSNL